MSVPSSILRLSALPGILVLGAGCGGAGGLQVKGGANSARMDDAAITIDAINSAPPAQWRLDALGKAYVNRSKVQITGYCPRGIRQVKLTSAGSALGANADCGVDGRFAWSGNLPDATYPLSFNPVFGGTPPPRAFPPTQQTLVVDTVPPPPPVILTNRGIAIRSLNPSISLEGENDADADTMQVTGQGSLRPIHGIALFDFDVSLAAGETRTVTFVAVDFAGNRSDPTTIDLSHLATVAIDDRGFIGHSRNGPVNSADGRWTMDSSSVAPMLREFAAGADGRSLAAGVPALLTISNP